MFSLYGHQYEEREEHLLLCMFEVNKKFVFLMKFSQGSRWCRSRFLPRLISAAKKYTPLKIVFKLINHCMRGGCFTFYLRMYD